MWKRELLQRLCLENFASVLVLVVLLLVRLFIVVALVVVYRMVMCPAGLCIQGLSIKIQSYCIVNIMCVICNFFISFR